MTCSPPTAPFTPEKPRGFFFGAHGPAGLLIQVFPLDPRPEDVFICSIARGLAGESRFINQTLGFFPVASHCVEASLLAHEDGSAPTAEEQLERLMHDGSEATLRDMPRPMKKAPEMALDGYRRAEHGRMAAIAERYDIAPCFWDKPHVKYADLVVYRTEVRDLRQPRSWIATEPSDYGPMLPFRLRPTTPIAAERRFLERFIELCSLTGRHAAAAEGREALAQVPPDPMVALEQLRAAWPRCRLHKRPAQGSLDGELVCAGCGSFPTARGVVPLPASREMMALFDAMEDHHG